MKAKELIKLLERHKDKDVVVYAAVEPGFVAAEIGVGDAVIGFNEDEVIIPVDFGAGLIRRNDELVSNLWEA
jgi:hypothetical protein